MFLLQYTKTYAIIPFCQSWCHQAHQYIGKRLFGWIQFVRWTNVATYFSHILTFLSITKKQKYYMETLLVWTWLIWQHSSVWNSSESRKTVDIFSTSVPLICTLSIEATKFYPLTGTFMWLCSHTSFPSLINQALKAQLKYCQCQNTKQLNLTSNKSEVARWLSH